MLQLADLVGREFAGYFQRDPEHVGIARAHRANLVEHHPAEVHLLDSERGSSDTEDGVADRQYDFNVRILLFNPQTGMFIAKGDDFFGESGLVGLISDPAIWFKKIYAGHRPQLPPDFLRLETIDHQGNFHTEDNKLILRGTYRPLQWGPSNPDHYRGIWHLESQLN